MKQFQHLNCKRANEPITLNGPAGKFEGTCKARFEYLGHNFAVTQTANQRNYSITEITTGLRVIGGPTIVKAIELFLGYCAQRKLTTEDFSKAIEAQTAD